MNRRYEYLARAAMEILDEKMQSIGIATTAMYDFGTVPVIDAIEQSHRDLEIEADRIFCTKWPEEFKRGKFELVHQYEHYQFPKGFGSTAGPFGGFGGQGFTSFQIDVFAIGEKAVVFCGGRFWKIVEDFQFGGTNL